MPSPSAIWVCDRPSCWRIRRKRGPTKSFFPESVAMAGSLNQYCDKSYKITSMTGLYVTRHHHSKSSRLYEIGILAFSSRHVSQCTVKNVDWRSGEDKRCRFVVTERIMHMN